MATALVIGGGIGGMAVAAAALKHFNKVTVIERDDLTGSRVAEESIAETKKRRSGVAQYTEPHTLLAGGALALDHLVPGFKDELVKRGSLRYDIGEGLRVYDFGAPYIRGFKADAALMGASRRLINETLQDLVIGQAGERLVIRDRTKVAGLKWELKVDSSSGKANKSKTSIRGVILDSGEELEADVVFVCSGRRSQLPSWLKEGGVHVPDQLKVDCKVNYASRWMKLPADFDPKKECYAAVVQGRPHLSRGGLFLALENGMAQLSLTGFEGERAPTDEAGWMEYAASLPDKIIHDLASRCEPMGPIGRFASAPNVTHQYHKTKLPEGLVIMGDAAAALNPVYGQGMSVAAQAAEVLDRHLAVLLKSKSVPEKRIAAVRQMGPKLQVALHKQAVIGWQMSTSEDMRWKDVEVVGVSRPPKLLYRYFDSVLLAGHKDPKVGSKLLRVAQFLDPPTGMFSGRMLRKTFKYMVIGNNSAKKGFKPAEPIIGGSAAEERVSSEMGKDLDASVGHVMLPNAVAA